MALFAVAGSHIYIGAALADKATDFIEADFGTQSWLEIDGWVTAGTFGDAAQLISTDLINRGRTVKQKGTKNGGQMQNVWAIIPDDPGQLAVLAAADAPDSYAFRVVWSDGSTRYFIALVMMGQEAGGGANTINNLNATLELNSNVVKVAAP